MFKSHVLVHFGQGLEVLLLFCKLMFLDLEFSCEVLFLLLVKFVLLFEGVLELDGFKGFLGQLQVELVEGLLFDVELFFVL